MWVDACTEPFTVAWLESELEHSGGEMVCTVQYFYILSIQKYSEREI